MRVEDLECKSLFDSFELAVRPLLDSHPATHLLRVGEWRVEGGGMGVGTCGGWVQHRSHVPSWGNVSRCFHRVNPTP